MMKYLQKLGKSLMLPVAVLPICGLLMGIGYALCPSTMQGGDVVGLAQIIGFLLVKAGGALIDNMQILFVIGVAIGMADEPDGTPALAGLASWLMVQQLLSVGVVTVVMPSITEGSTQYIAFSKISNPFIGIICGLIGAWSYNHFKGMQLPDFLAFFSGKRFVAMAAAVVSIIASVILLFVWPLVFGALLLIPIGMHHALNNVFWFETIGLGDLTNFWAGKTSADVTWSLGMYMSGFFPCMMFGVPAAAAAMIATAKNKKAAAGLLISTAVCAFVCGVTEPFEFSFMFVAFPLYVVYAILYGVMTVITYFSGFRAGFSFSAGATDLVFSASLPAAEKTWMILPLGILAAVLFFAVFYVLIKTFNFKTPGREDEDENTDAEKKVVLANNNYTQVAAGVLAAIGGKGNVKNVEYCATRLRFEINDYTAVDEKAVKNAGAAGVVRPSKNACQVIIGPKVQFVYDELKKML